MTAVLVAVAIVLMCRGTGSVAALLLKRPHREDRYTCLAYACAVGALVGVIW